MRVLLPTIRDPGQIGGTTTHLDMLSHGLEQLGHEPHVLYLGAHIPRPLRLLGIVWPAGFLNWIRRGWGMTYAAVVRGRLLAFFTRRELARGGWDVLNAQEVYSAPALRKLADEYGVPLVLTLHGYPFYESMSEGYTARSRMGMTYLMRAELRAFRMADAMVTVDSRLRRHASKLAPHRVGRIRGLMNFVDASTFSPETEGREQLRATLGIDPGQIVLFCPRRLVKKNGVVFPALALASMTLEERARYTLLFAGEGGERKAVEAVVAENGLEERVRLLGACDRDEIRTLYKLCDIVLVPSVHSQNVEEATSLAALEAMASGRPLVAGAIGGLREIVRDGDTGLLVPAEDPRALARAIARLADDPVLAAEMGERGREYVIAHHSHVRAAESYVEVFEQAVSRRAKPLGAHPGAALDSEEGGPRDRLAPFPSISVLGLPVHDVDLERGVAWLLERSRRPPGSGGLIVATSFNPELVIRAQRDERAASALLAADLRFPDGVGAVWAARRQGAYRMERVPGIELAERLLTGAASEGLPVYFLGGEPGVAEAASRAMADRYPALVVAGWHDGYFDPAEEDEVVARIAASEARLLLVAMGAPRQEIFLERHREALGASIGLGVGGSFDVWSGRVRRAPATVRRLGVEWLYRLVTDPRRLRRQLVLPEFAWRVLRGVADDYGPGRSAKRLWRPEGAEAEAAELARSHAAASPDGRGDSQQMADQLGERPSPEGR